MSKDLDVKVIDSYRTLVKQLRESEVAIEQKVESDVGEFLDFRFRQGSFQMIAEAKAHSSGAFHGDVCVVRLASPGQAQERLNRITSAVHERRLGGALVVTTDRIFNKPAFQKLRLGGDPVSLLVKSDATPEQEELIEHLSSIIQQMRSREEDGQEAERQHPPYLRASATIRNEESGRLDAKLIAEVFGIPKSGVAKIVGVKPQTLWKTPDSGSLQEKLFPFEEIIRGVLLLDGDLALFRKWLNMPSNELPKIEGRHLCPMDVIKRGHPEVVAGMVENALTGHPA